MFYFSTPPRIIWNFVQVKFFLYKIRQESELNQLKRIIQEKNADLAGVAQEIKEIKAEIRENENKLKQLKQANGDLDERRRTLEVFYLVFFFF